MVHIYHGDGKGKTTAAIGLALRMAGYGKRVFIIQFLKGKPSGEMMALLKLPGITVLRGQPSLKFPSQMCEEEIAQVSALQQRQLQLAVSAVERGDAEMIVLDEVLDAIGTGTLSEAELIRAIHACASRAEIILTGRNPSDQLFALADYVTCMRKEKHPFDQGVQARKGVEY